MIVSNTSSSQVLDNLPSLIEALEDRRRIIGQAASKSMEVLILTSGAQVDLGGGELPIDEITEATQKIAQIYSLLLFEEVAIVRMLRNLGCDI